MQIEKEDIKLSLFTDDMIEYVGKELAKKKKKKNFVMIDYSKFVRLKANIWKSINILHNCNDYVVFEIVNNTVYITIHKMKYLGKSLTMYKSYMGKPIWTKSNKNQING